MKRFRKSLLAALAGLTFGGCLDLPTSEQNVTKYKDPPVAVIERPETDESKVELAVNSLNFFGLTIFSHLASQQSGNLALSPVGSYLLLELIYDGSSLSARESIAKNFERSRLGLEEAALLAWELNQLPSTQVAQRIYVDESVQIKGTYLERVEPLLGVSVETVPLVNDPELAGRQVSQWISEQTGGMLQGSLVVPRFPTLAVLVSTLNFRGRWSTEFSEADTKLKRFYLADGTMAKVLTMHLREVDLGRLEIPHGQAVILPYLDGAEMVLMLPDEGFTIDQVLQELKPSVHLSEKVKFDHLLNLELPRFEIKVQDLDLTSAWMDVGLGEALNKTDLTMMLTSPQAIFLDVMIRHHLLIRVDERGTHAAAATTSRLIPASAPDPEKIETLRFNRPFAFILRHTRTGAILVLGRVERP